MTGSSGFFLSKYDLLTGTDLQKTCCGKLESLRSGRLFLFASNASQRLSVVRGRTRDPDWKEKWSG